MLLIFSAIFITSGLALRRNWLGLADQLSGKHVSDNPLTHERSFPWHGARVAGAVAVCMGVAMLMSFAYISIKNLVS